MGPVKAVFNTVKRHLLPFWTHGGIGHFRVVVRGGFGEFCLFGG